jgi:hypothetical protein
MKKKIPLALVFIAGVSGLVAAFVPHPIVKAGDEIMRNDVLRIIQSFAFILALSSLVSVHTSKIRARRHKWPYSIVLLASFLITSVIGLGGGVSGKGILPTQIGNFNFNIQTIYQNVIIALSTSMFALLAFYMASASYRAFRIRSFEATLLLSAAFIVMLGVLPIGDAISHHLPAFAQWILDVPNAAGQRGIAFGIALGGLATALKIVLGIERSWLGGGGA